MLGMRPASYIATLVALLLVCATSVTSAGAAELLMVEERGCPWCARWHKEVGPGYPRSAEGKRAPLRQVDIGAVHKLGLKLAAPVTVSPTFILIDDGREIGRIVGYPGADFFWGLLAELIAKLDARSSGSTTSGAVAVPDRGYRRPGRNTPSTI